MQLFRGRSTQQLWLELARTMILDYTWQAIRLYNNEKLISYNQKDVRWQWDMPWLYCGDFFLLDDVSKCFLNIISKYFQLTHVTHIIHVCNRIDATWLAAKKNFKQTRNKTCGSNHVMWVIIYGDLSILRRVKNIISRIDSNSEAQFYSGQKLWLTTNVDIF